MQRSQFRRHSGVTSAGGVAGDQAKEMHQRSYAVTAWGRSSRGRFGGGALTWLDSLHLPCARLRCTVLRRVVVSARD